MNHTTLKWENILEAQRPEPPALLKQMMSGWWGLWMDKLEAICLPYSCSQHQGLFPSWKAILSGSLINTLKIVFPSVSLDRSSQQIYVTVTFSKALHLFPISITNLPRSQRLKYIPSKNAQFFLKSDMCSLVCFSSPLRPLMSTSNVAWFYPLPSPHCEDCTLQIYSRPYTIILDNLLLALLTDTGAWKRLFWAIISK